MSDLHPLWTETSWGSTHALVAGPDAGENVVIVPGLGVSAYLRPSAEALAAAGFRCWLVDPPGFGDSGDPPRPLDITEIAEAVTAWLATRELPPVALIGHSSGTQAAARIAATEPDRITRLVLGSPTVDPKYRSWPVAFSRWLLDGTREPPSLTRTQRPEWRRAGPRRLLHLLRSMKADRLEETLARVDCPVLVVRGARDPLSTSEWIEALTADSDRTLVEVAGLAHAFPYAAPDSFVNALNRARK